MFRSSPFHFLTTFNLSTACDIRENQHFILLDNDGELDSSSLFQAETLSFQNCSMIGHLTCDLYCHYFNSCDALVRIDSFLTRGHDNVCEILIKGPQHVMTILYYFLSSREHCEIMINPYINHIGVSYEKHDKSIFVGDVANIYNSKFDHHFINAFYQVVNTETYFYTSSRNSSLVSLHIDDLSYRMRPFFNQYFFNVRINKTFRKDTSYYFSDSIQNSTIYKIVY